MAYSSNKENPECLCHTLLAIGKALSHFRTQWAAVEDEPTADLNDLEHRNHGLAGMVCACHHRLKKSSSRTHGADERILFSMEKNVGLSKSLYVGVCRVARARTGRISV